MTKRRKILPTTELRNRASENIDRLSTQQIVDLINSEDSHVPAAVALQRKQIAAAIDLIVARFKDGGRLFYVGAGTSGRLGVLDASECPPTFGVPPSLVQGIIAGGRRALVRSAEGNRKETRPGNGRRSRLGRMRHDTFCTWRAQTSPANRSWDDIYHLCAGGSRAHSC
jgi:N-acetylmuramic acid 6-phosphate etherase